MKRLLFGLGLIALVGTGCSKDDDSVSSSPTNAQLQAHQEKIRQAETILPQYKFAKNPLILPNHHPSQQQKRPDVQQKY